MKYLNFFETYFGISPDGGDGSWELMALVIVVVLGAVTGLLLANRNPKDEILS
jgi:hypothetical protein